MIRIHLWNVNDREDVIFIIKNIYGIFGYLRGVYSDIKILHKERRRRCDQKNDESVYKEGNDVSVNNRRRDEGKDDSVEMSKLV